MTDNTVNVALTEDEIKQIASGDVSIALRNKLGLKSFTIKITTTFDFVYTESEPFVYEGEDGEELEVFTVEAFEEAYQKNPELVKESILYECDYESTSPESVTFAFGDKVVRITP